MPSPIAHLDDAWLDVLVLGGGIAGAAAVRELAQAGYRAALVEPRDFGWGSSGRSSRLIHGGLRYLAAGRLGLVRRALHARLELVRAAPHLVRPCAFVLPLREGDPAWRRHLWRTGVTLYDWLARPRRGWPAPREVELETVQVLLPGLAHAEGDRYLLYHDAVTDDRRLTLLTALDARRLGASLCTRCELLAVEPESGGQARATLRDSLDGTLARVRVGAVVNATGAWVDRVRRQLGLEGRPLLRPTRGAHLVVNRPAAAAALLPHPDDGRVTLLVPCFGGLLAGTTDEDDTRAPDEIAATAPDLSYLTRLLDEAFPGTPSPVAAHYAGFRPLLAGRGHPDRLSRRHRIAHEQSAGVPVLSLAGGKLTSHRECARDLLRAVRRTRVRPSDAPRSAQPCLPGGNVTSLDGEVAAACAAGLTKAQAGWVVGRYGARWRELLAENGAARPLAEASLPLAGELAWAIREEALRTLSDLLLRWRVPEVWPEEEPGIVAATAQQLAVLLSWSPARMDRELERWRRERDAVYGPPDA